ncbi:succinate dehydrogenase assembly factor 2 [soil metagenome]
MLSPPDDDPRLKKLRFRAWRRGFREADLILGGFADAHLASLDSGQLDRFEALLEEHDVELYTWIIETAPTPPAFDHDVMHLIKDFRHSAFASLGVRGG